jgi:hypothetical protein
LHWIEKKYENPDEDSKPDYLMERLDGKFDILDLKTGAIRYKSLTKGGKARIRFVDYVDELVAQLVVYKRYFGSLANKEWAYEKYGIQTDNIRLIGIVGNQNNFIQKEVSAALKKYADEIVILSYPDLVALLRKRIQFAALPSSYSRFEQNGLWSCPTSRPG